MTTRPAHRTGISSVSKSAELRRALQKLADLNPTLVAMTEQADAAFRATSDALAKFALDIDGSVYVEELEAPTDVWEATESIYVKRARGLFLIHARIAGRMQVGFQSAVTRTDPKSGDELSTTYADPVPWEQAPREWKLAGIVKLADLVTHIAQSAEFLVSSTAGALEEVEAILEDLKDTW